MIGRSSALLLQEPDEEEEAGRDDPVVEHEEHRADHGNLSSDDDAERDEAHLGERGVGDEALQLGRPARDERAVEDRDDGEGRARAGAASASASGKSPMSKRKMPYVPSLASSADEHDRAGRRAPRRR